MTRYQLLVKFANDLDQEQQNYYNSIQNNNTEDSGFDLMVDQDYIISINENVWFLDFKVNCAMYDTIEDKYVGYYLYPRSSFSKYKLIMANHVGIIDAGYRGNIKGAVRLYVGTDFESQLIEKGTRLFQLCAPDLSPFSVKIVDSLPDSIRGIGGFGSTGK